MNVGFIGTGSMGSILIESFIRSGALLPGQIYASNRTPDKVQRLAEQYPGLHAKRSNIDIVRQCQTIFVCVKPLEFKSVIEEIRNAVVPSHVLVSITSPVLIKHLEDQLPCKIAKIVPSITNYEFSGTALCVYGTRIEAGDRRFLEHWFERISIPVEVPEQYVRVSSDLSSIGPACLSFFLQKMIDAAVAETGLSREDATRLACEMALGTGKLLTSGSFTPEQLRQRVAVPGGITAEVLRLMDEELEGLFNRIIRTTHNKYNDDVEKLHFLFYGQIVD